MGKLIYHIRRAGRSQVRFNIMVIRSGRVLSVLAMLGMVR